jgi:16S rRNA (guanine(966)-N(2))-methyltransferase RsmD
MQRSQSTVTIGAGVWRGRVLAYPAGPGIRPSMQRTRSSMFSSLGARLTDAVFADLFAGGGVVGIEALSRGAARAHFVERAPDAVAAIRANLRTCGVGADRATLHADTVAAVLDLDPCPISDATIVFADPPYDVDANAEILHRFRTRTFHRLEWVIVEHRARAALTPPAGLVLSRERRFGDTMLSYLRPDGDAGASEGGTP